MKTLMFLAITAIISTNCLQAQVNEFGIPSYTLKPPKYVITLSLSYNYAFSGSSDVLTFSQDYDPVQNKAAFSSTNYAMSQGFGIFTQGKMATDKKRKFRLTGSLSYNHFYNTRDNGLNRTRWQFFNVGAGVDYSFKPRSQNRPFVGAELLYTLIWGAWQSNVTFPDNSTSNVYTKFNTAHRLGLALMAGMEFKTSRNTAVLLALRGVWANVLPKNSNYNDKSYSSYINDGERQLGSISTNTKQIIFIQLMAGVNFQIRK
jgi:outer membrane protein W